MESTVRNKQNPKFIYKKDKVNIYMHPEKKQIIERKKKYTSDHSILISKSLPKAYIIVK